jgi:hypothetical protein
VHGIGGGGVYADVADCTEREFRGGVNEPFGISAGVVRDVPGKLRDFCTGVSGDFSGTLRRFY